jgi:hypothetical protein
MALINNDSDILKKMHVLAIVRDESEDEALIQYPELESFIYSIRGKTYSDAKTELLRESQMDLVLH